MKTSDGKVYSEKQIQEARNQTAQVFIDHAEEIKGGKVEFGGHVTKERQLSIAQENLDYAEEVKQGKHDSNFVIWQRMNFYLTGECPAFLP